MFRHAFKCSAATLEILGHTRSLTHFSPRIAFALDIDGVLLQGRKAIPSARDAIKFLKGRNTWKQEFPFVLLTNGGGITEAERARSLSESLGVDIVEEQVIQSHTVLKPGALHHADLLDANEHVLVVGGHLGSVRDVAASYGLQNVYTPFDVLAWDPSIWPFHKLSHEEYLSTKQVDFSQIAISSICVFHDSRNWGLDIQVMTDVISSFPKLFRSCHLPAPDHSKRPNADSRRALKLIFANPDLVWKAEWAFPRFGQGAFREAFQAVFKAQTGSIYPFLQVGKPHEVTYTYAATILERQSCAIYGSSKDLQFVMIGGKLFSILSARGKQAHVNLSCLDNPESDIAGANNAGWKSMLVKTGVYNASIGLPRHKPTHTVNNVLEGVMLSLK